MTQDDPLVTQGDPRVTQDDPRVTQDDPRVTQDDPMMTLEDPRVTQDDHWVTQDDPDLWSCFTLKESPEILMLTELALLYNLILKGVSYHVRAVPQLYKIDR